ncbi:MAG: hypothetical protein GTO54_02765 [Nitrososphaeria archaeon]|nr:hypothetical protein [Nitrososphaeria archaeon]
MKDVVDVINEESHTLCPECGNYDDTEYKYHETLDSDDIDDVIQARRQGLSLCGICGRYFG